jgi:hypothetical protein
MASAHRDIPGLELRTLAVGAAASVAVVVAGSAAAQPLFGTPQWLGDAGPRVVAAGDIDKDGSNDLVVSNYDGQSVTVFYNDGMSEELAPVTYGASSDPYGSVDCVVLGDLDGDGDLDIVTAHSQTDQVGVMLNDGGGSFDPIVHYDNAIGACRITLAPIDDNGSLDIVVSGNSGSEFWTLFGNGDGSFQPPVGQSVGHTQLGNASGDLDGDLWNDVVVCNHNAGNVKIFLNDQNGAYFENGSVELEWSPVSVVVADLDGQDRADLAVACDSERCVVIALNDGTGVFTYDSRIDLPSEPRWIAGADIDDDGDLDLLTANHETGEIGVLLSNQAQKDPADPLEYTLVASPGTVWRPTCVASADMDGDGDLDLAAVGEDSHSAGVVLNFTGPLDTEPRFGGVTRRDSTWGAAAVALGDIGEDPDHSDRDAVLVTWEDTGGTYYMAVHPNDGAGALGDAAMYSVHAPMIDVVLEDLDRDGDRDIATLERDPDDPFTLMVAPNDGSGGFAIPAQVDFQEAVTGGVALRGGDLDGDGFLDLVAAGDKEVAVLLNSTDLTFAATLHGTSVGQNDITLGDIDDDGDLDILYAAANCGFLPNNGDGTFGPAVSFDTNGGDPGGTIEGDLIALVSYYGVRWPIIVDEDVLTLTRLRGTGARAPGDFEVYDVYPTGPAPKRLIAAAVDNFASTDLLLADAGDDSVWVYRFKPLLNFYAGPVAYGVSQGPRDLAIGDMDRDTRPDLVAANRVRGGVSVLLHAPTPFVCVGDLNGDQMTNVFDFAELAGNFGMGPGAVRTDGDLNGDGDVNVFDFAELAADFGCTGDPGARR